MLAVLLVVTALGSTASPARLRAKSALLSRTARIDPNGASQGPEREAMARLVDDLVASYDGAEDPLRCASKRSGKWRLVYTDRPGSGVSMPFWKRPMAAVHQIIDTREEPWLMQNCMGPPSFATATAKLVPRDGSGTLADVFYVEMRTFGILSQPNANRGTTEFVYADSDLLVTRGNRGNTFVLSLADPGAAIPRVRRGGKGYYMGQDS